MYLSRVKTLRVRRRTSIRQRKRLLLLMVRSGKLRDCEERMIQGLNQECEGSEHFHFFCFLAMNMLVAAGRFLLTSAGCGGGSLRGRGASFG